jgi:hypothetical protein
LQPTSRKIGELFLPYGASLLTKVIQFIRVRSIVGMR